MSTDSALLRDTLEIAMQSDLHFGERFYRTLFARHPELKALFQRNSPGAQTKMFAQKLAAIVDHLEDPAWLSRELPAMSSSHRHYGVSEAMYAPVGEVLIDVLREACGAAWSPQAEAAWLSAYRALSQAMLGHGR